MDFWTYLFVIFRLVGCTDLLTDVRAKLNRNDQLNGDANGQKPARLAKLKSQQRYAFYWINITYSIQYFSQQQRLSQSDEVYAALRLDNRVVATTDTKSMGKECWNQLFTVDLDRAKELEIEVSYRDPRSMCAFSVIRIGDYVESAGTTKKILELEPQGQLFAEASSIKMQLFIILLLFRFATPIQSKGESRV